MQRKTEFFKHCKESIDGITCSVCEDNYFFDDDNLCTIVKYCSKSKSPYECEECISGYYLTEYEESCTPEKIVIMEIGNLVYAQYAKKIIILI